MASTALNGIRVLDLSRVLAAPLATQMLGDLGAEIIKIERPGGGDDSRDYGPPFLYDADGKATRESAFYLSCNRNKRSISVDITKPEGQKIIYDLVKNCDVMIENFKTGALKKYGLDYASIRVINPNIIYCSVTGFGQTGPLSHKPGYDGVFQSMSGFMSVSGLPDGVPGGGPMKHGASMVDILTSLYASIALLTALYNRDARKGVGQHLDISLLDCGFASLSHVMMNYLVSGQLPQRRGNGGFGGIPSQTFKCSDNELVFLTCGNDMQYERLCGALEHPELASDARFNTGPLRIANRDALVPLLEAIFLTRPAAEWLDRLEVAQIPSSPVNNLEQAVASPQIQHREMVQTIAHPVGGDVRIIRNPLRFSETPIEGYSPPPGVGQDTDDVLKGLNYDPAQIADLKARKIV